MFSILKVFLKKHLPFYSFFRSASFPIYEKERRQKLKAMPEYGISTFRYANTTFPIYLSSKNGFVDEEIYWKGCYEEDVLAIIKERLLKGATYIDIGSNIGEHALFASIINPTGKVIAFEPIKRLFKQFSDSINLNKVQNITVYNHGCGEVNSTAEISFSTSNIGGASLVESAGRDLHESISIVRGDTILLSEKWIDLIKIDTEGFELEVLLGIRETIKKFKPELIIEYSPVLYKEERKDNGIKILQLLEEEQYEVTTIDDGGKVHLTNNLPLLAQHYHDQVNIICTPRHS